MASVKNKIAACLLAISFTSGTGGIDNPFFDSVMQELKKKKQTIILDNIRNCLFIIQNYKVHNNVESVGWIFVKRVFKCLISVKIFKNFGSTMVSTVEQVSNLSIDLH